MSILRNAGWLVIGNVTSELLALVLYLSLARTFGEAGIGDYAFAFAVAGLLGLLVDFGFQPLIMREVARDHHAVHIREFLSIQVLLAFTGGVLLYAFVLFSNPSSQAVVLVTMAYLHTVLMSIGRMFVAHLQGLEQMRQSAALIVAARLIIVIIGFGLLAGGAPLTVISVAYVIGAGCYALLAAYFYRRTFGAGFMSRSPYRKVEILRRALPFAAALALYELYSRADMILLHVLRGEIETGRYAAVYRLVTTPLFVAGFIGVSVYPLLSRSQGHDVQELRSTYTGLVKWLAVIAALGSVLIIVVGGPVADFLYGDKFSDAARLMPWMSLLFFVDFAKVPFWRLLLAVNREREVLFIQAVSVAVNVILNVLLIPGHGALGAVWASMVSQSLAFVALERKSGRLINSEYRKFGPRLAVASAISVAVGYPLGDIVIWPIQTIIVTGVWLVSAMAIQLLDRRDYRLFRKLVKRRTDPIEVTESG